MPMSPLEDLVVAVREHRDNEAEFVEKVKNKILEEECRGTDPTTKAHAVLKLFYLQMLGYDVHEAAAITTEVFCQPKLYHKRLGYLAASEIMKCDDSILLLSTNVLQRDLRSRNPLEVIVAANCLACVATEQVSESLLSTVLELLANTEPYVQRKALLLLFRLLSEYPAGLDNADVWARLKQKLVDSNVRVAMSAASLVCELSYRFPERTTAMIPALFRLLGPDTQPWVTIKLLKALGYLCERAEPRLVTKLVEPLMEVLNGARSASVMLEAVGAAVTAARTQKTQYGSVSADMEGLLELASEKLSVVLVAPESFAEHKAEFDRLGVVPGTERTPLVLGLEALQKIHFLSPKVVARHREVIFAALDDVDAQVQVAAVKLLATLATERTAESVIKRILDVGFPVAGGAEITDEENGGSRKHGTTAELRIFQALVAEHVLAIVEANDFALVDTNEEFCVRTVAALAWRGASVCGAAVARVIERLVVARPAAAVTLAGELLEKVMMNARLFADARSHDHAGRADVVAILGTSAHVVGRYGSLEAIGRANGIALVYTLLTPVNAALPTDCQLALITAATMLVVREGGASADPDSPHGTYLAMIDVFAASPCGEVAQCASEGLRMLGGGGAPGTFASGMNAVPRREAPAPLDTIIDASQWIVDTNEFTELVAQNESVFKLAVVSTEVETATAEELDAKMDEIDRGAANIFEESSTDNDDRLVLSYKQTEEKPVVSTAPKSRVTEEQLNHDPDAWLLDMGGEPLPEKKVEVVENKIDELDILGLGTSTEAPKAAPQPAAPAGGNSLDDLLGL